MNVSRRTTPSKDPERQGANEVSRPRGLDDATRKRTGVLFDTMYLLLSFRKSSPPQNRQLIVYYYCLEY